MGHLEAGIDRDIRPAPDERGGIGINLGGEEFGPIHASSPASPPDEEEGTIAFALQQTLTDRGPTRLADLMDEAESILPEGRSVNSIGPVLLMRPDLFVRALPGVYALPNQVSELQAAMPADWPVLFNDNQARLPSSPASWSTSRTASTSCGCPRPAPRSFSKTWSRTRNASADAR